MAGRILIAVAAALVLAGAAAAQGGEEPNVVARLRAAYLAAEERDAARAVEYLTDPRWYVRRFVLVRLRAMGLPQDAFAAVQGFAVPSAEGKPDEATLAPCRAWAKTVAKAPEGALYKPDAVDAVTAAASIIEEEMRFARSEPARGRGLLLGLADLLTECEGQEERSWLAGRLLDDLEGERVLKELGLPALPGGEKELKEAAVRLRDWCAAQAGYLWYHPGERRFRLDEPARAAATPTDEFRKTHPWGEKEGPNAPSDRPGPVR